MSDGDEIPNESMGELRDGQLQIVEVAPYHNGDNQDCLEAPSAEGTQMYIDSAKGVVHLDLLNWTLVRCDDGGEGTYKLVSNADSSESEFVTPDTVTCVLQSSDGEEQDGQDAYVMVEGDAEQDQDEEYVMLQTSGGPVVYLDAPPAPPPPAARCKEEPPRDQMTAEMMLQRARALQKAKRLLTESMRPRRGPGRRRQPLPSPAALLASPAFRLFLYACKRCAYRCNAMKDLAAHRLEKHGGSSNARVGPSRPRAAPAAPVAAAAAAPAARPLLCSKCAYAATSAVELMRHIQDTHDLMGETMGTAETAETENTEETANVQYKECRLSELSGVASGSLLVCGACGHEAASVAAFRRHVRRAHPRRDPA